MSGPWIAFMLSMLIVVAVIDLDHGLILDRIVFPVTVAALLLAPLWTNAGLPRPFLGSEAMLASFLNSSLAGTGAFLFLLAIVLLYPQGMGGSDVKLAGLIGFLVGYPWVITAVWLAIVGGGVVASLLLLFRKRGRKDAIPFGPFLALGAVGALFTPGETFLWRW